MFVNCYEGKRVDNKIELHTYVLDLKLKGETVVEELIWSVENLLLYIY